MAVLLETVTGTRRDPVLEWLESDPAVRSVFNEEPERKDHAIALLERLAESLRDIRNRTAHAIEPMPDPRLGAWVLGFYEAIEGLRGLRRIPEATAQLSILENARAGIARVSRLLADRNHPETSAAFALGRHVEELVGQIRERLLGTVILSATPHPDAIFVGQQSEVILRVKNDSALPVRNVRIETEPQIGRGEFEFFPPSSDRPVTLSPPAPDAPGVFDITAIWRAERLDGRPVRGTIPLRLQVRTAVAPITTVFDIGSSPYITGAPVQLDRPEMFVGRDDIMSRIRLQFPPDRAGNVVLLIGNRRMGKTSILKRLETPNALPGWLVAYCTLQSGQGDKKKPGVPTQEIYRLLATRVGEVAAATEVRVWLPGAPPPAMHEPFPLALSSASRKLFTEDHPFELLDQYLQMVMDAIRPRRLLLVVDEFDKIQEGIDTGVTSPQVPANLRALLHKHSDLSAVLSGAMPLGTQQRDYWSAMFGFGYRINVSILPLEAARNLVTRPVAGKLAYIDEARDQLVTLCGQHPYLIQLVCNRVFEEAYESRSRTVSLTAVQSAAGKVIGEKNLHFDTIWQEIESDRRRFLLALGDRLAEGTDPVNLALLETKCEEFGVEFPDGPEGLENDLEHLASLELLNFDDGAYRLPIPLMAKWIRRKDFDALHRRAVRESQEQRG